MITGAEQGLGLGNFRYKFLGDESGGQEERDGVGMK